MLAELSLQLKSDQKIEVWHSSMLQGVLMEHVSPQYADKLHQTGLHPYSQCIIHNKEKEPIWKIRTLDDEACKEIIDPWLVSSNSSFVLNKKEISVDITEKSFKKMDESELLKSFYSDNTDKRITVCFETPTAFKSDSNYVFMPEVRLIFGSLMRKYTASSNDMDMTDEETLDYLVDHTRISSFRIRSTVFNLEGVRIPSFVGNITFSFYGTDTMARYARMLLEYGEFSGVGIKSGIGMGAIKILKGGNNER